jgi:hypothetical protein
MDVNLAKDANRVWRAGVHSAASKAESPDDRTGAGRSRAICPRGRFELAMTGCASALCRCAMAGSSPMGINVLILASLTMFDWLARINTLSWPASTIDARAVKARRAMTIAVMRPASTYFMMLFPV